MLFVRPLAKLLRDSFLVPRAQITKALCLTVARQIAAMIPTHVWLVQTDVENNGMDQMVCASYELALETAGGILREWLADFGPDYEKDVDNPRTDHWHGVQASIEAALDAGDEGQMDQYQAAIEIWNTFQGDLAECDAEISVTQMDVQYSS